MKIEKKHYLYIGIGVAVLLGLYFAFGACDCKGKFTARVKQESQPDEAANVEFESKEI